jgi:hypothetical protein
MKYEKTIDENRGNEARRRRFQIGDTPLIDLHLLLDVHAESQMKGNKIIF